MTAIFDLFPIDVTTSPLFAPPAYWVLNPPDILASPLTTRAEPLALAGLMFIPTEESPASTAKA